MGAGKGAGIERNLHVAGCLAQLMDAVIASMETDIAARSTEELVRAAIPNPCLDHILVAVVMLASEYVARDISPAVLADDLPAIVANVALSD